jgi:hypothetical protein
MAGVGEEFPLECPACGGDIRLIAFITELGHADARKTPTKRVRGVSRNPLRTPGPAPPETHESLISRKTVAEVPLTGHSFILLCDYRLTDVHESLVKGILA